MARRLIPLESAVERQFLREVKKRRLPVKLRKMNGLGYVDWPDRLVVGPKRFFRWIEFKRPKVGRVSPGQAAMFEELGDWGHEVKIFTDGKEATDWVEQEMKAHGC